MRRLLATAVTLLVALSLTGCMKVDAAIEVHEDSTISGEMTMGVSKAMKEMMESLATEFGDDMETAPDPDSDPGADSGFDDDFFESDEIPEGATVEPYEDDKFVGETMKFEGITIDELNASAGETDSDDTADGWTLVREGDTFVFNAEGDFSSEDAEELEDNPMAAGMEELFADSEIRIAVTFPGDVIEATGDIDGRTVTWTPKFGEKITMNAVAEADDNSVIPDILDPTSGDGGVNVLLFVVVGVFVLLVLALAALLVIRRRKQPVA